MWVSAALRHVEVTTGGGAGDNVDPRIGVFELARPHEREAMASGRSSEREEAEATNASGRWQLGGWKFSLSDFSGIGVWGVHSLVKT